MPQKRRLWLPPQILWHEGMMLSPQHFQQNDLRIQTMVGHFQHLMAPYAWGIHRLVIDTLSLATGNFRIQELDCVMPDGLLVHYVAAKEHSKPLEIDLRPYKSAHNNDELTIYLSITKNPDTDASHSPTEGRYYETPGDETADYHLPDSLVSIPRVLPNLSLNVGDFPPPHTTGFPIIKLMPHASYAESTYIPPCIFISQDTHLWQKCRNLAIQMREKAGYLSSLWQTQVGSPMMRETEQLLNPLLTALPSLESCLSTPHISPYALFLNMLDVAGKLAPLRYAQLPPLMPAYMQHNITASFHPLLELIQNYIDSIEQSFSVFPFNKKEKLFYLHLSGSQIQNTLYIGLRTPKGATAEIMEEWMMDAVIASDFAVESVRNRRITGARRKRISPELEHELLPSRGVIIFEIDVDPDFISIDQNLNIFNANDSAEVRPVELILHIRKADVLKYAA